MMLHIPEVLTREQVAHFRRVLDGADWVNGKVTAGHQSARVKKNQQLPDGSPLAVELGGIIEAALAKDALFISAALPQKLIPPLFNRYEVGEGFGNHVDNAIRESRGNRDRVRTDMSCTLFFSDPDEYDGGELVVEDLYGAHEVKLPAGDLILYPSTSLHRVEPITRGARVASFFWVQSMIRNDWQRTMLFNLDTTIQKLRIKGGESDEVVALTSHYHNLLRMWAEL
ncbi:PKHD-type hydroxylase [Andreprevotia sp. IGB-42]|uniref:Fe2+-dependent dioxygenase n=1 Tax=Andreprevotia sp. IGB-42 TaxID=2497473 RepID=UPI00135816A4|nr:Fe2+-dependent dioxygenase [Andreprevotia sp. IGB-42]KAF0814427.1 PKHD-type hydroxylase [Andreprevotia sp. IGB-42]